MVAPLGRDGVGHLGLLRRSSEGSLKIQISRIDSSNEKRTAYGTAVIHIIRSPGRKEAPDAPSGTHKLSLELEEGDELKIDQRTFTVRRIIPKDFKGTKTIGWVEFGVQWKK